MRKFSFFIIAFLFQWLFAGEVCASYISPSSAVCSSTGGSVCVEGYPADNQIDGDILTYGYMTGSVGGNWWTLFDFGKNVLIKKFYARFSCQATAPTLYHLQYSFYSNTSPLITKSNLSTFSSLGSYQWEFDPDDFTARYVNFSITVNATECKFYEIMAEIDDTAEAESGGIDLTFFEELLTFGNNWSFFFWGFLFMFAFILGLRTKL